MVVWILSSAKPWLRFGFVSWSLAFTFDLDLRNLILYTSWSSTDYLSQFDDDFKLLISVSTNEVVLSWKFVKKAKTGYRISLWDITQAEFHSQLGFYVQNKMETRFLEQTFAPCCTDCIGHFESEHRLIICTLTKI